jgi:16S rRNA (uracil1498-N3)-methyltransferase
MTRAFVPADRLDGPRATLDAAAYRHLIKVLRLAPGASLRIFDGAGTEIDARIESVGRASVEVSLGARHRIAAPACAVSLLQAPPRGERMDLIVQKTTELGVARILPVQSERTQVRPGAHQRARWQTIAEEAARQSGRAEVPTIGEPAPLAAVLPTASDLADARFVLWEGEAGQSLPAALTRAAKAVVLLVGPEGGFAEAEVAAARRAGFVAVGLGPRILRSETAAIVAVALAQAAAGGLGGYLLAQ